MANNGLSSNEQRSPGQPGLEPQLPKRFYQDVTVALQEGEWAVQLDGRRVRTPAKNAFAMPNEDLANAVAEEWLAQVDVIDPATMPLTRIINSAHDGLVGKEADVRNEIAKFAGSDLLCYRADHPEQLVALQCAAWDGALKWLAQEHGICLQTGSGIMPIAQNSDDLAAFSSLLVTAGRLQLASLHVLVTISGSAVLGLAVLRGHMSVEEAWTAAHVDEDWQISQWGDDDEAQARRVFRKTEFEAAARLLELSG